MEALFAADVMMACAVQCGEGTKVTKGFGIE
jgi:hypothetical protein